MWNGEKCRRSASASRPTTGDGDGERAYFFNNSADFGSVLTRRESLTDGAKERNSERGGDVFALLVD